MNDTPLHIEQAAALRLLAEIVEHNPEFGIIARGAIGYMGMSTVSMDDPRESLTYVAQVLGKYGFDVKVKNETTGCTVEARVNSAMRITAHASAASLSQRPEYKPLTIPTGGAA